MLWGPEVTSAIVLEDSPYLSWGSRGLEREAAETELLVAPRVQIEDLRQLTAAVGIAHRDLLRL